MSDQARPAGTFCWHELGTRDAAAAKKFYKSLFGWKTKDMKSLAPGSSFGRVGIRECSANFAPLGRICLPRRAPSAACPVRPHDQNVFPYNVLQDD